MKKVFFTMAALCMAAGVFAQTTYGVKVGPDFSLYTSKASGSKETTKMLVGVAGGVYANVPIAPEFYVQPSLMYEGKGGKRKVGTHVKTRLNYLMLPVDLLFKPEMPNGSGAWIIGVGPYIGYGISSKSTYSDNGNEISLDPFKEDVFKRFDAGANVQLGYEMASGFNVGLNAELGLANLLKDAGGDSFRNTSFGVTVGYTLGKY